MALNELRMENIDRRKRKISQIFPVYFSGQYITSSKHFGGGELGSRKYLGILFS